MPWNRPTKFMNLSELGNHQATQEQVGEQTLAVVNDDGNEIATSVF